MQKSSAFFQSITYSIILVLTGHVQGARHRIIHQRIRRIPIVSLPSLTILRTGVDYSQFTLTMMVPGKNFRREPEGAPVLTNPPILLLLRAKPIPHGGQTSRPTMQSGGMARNGFKEIGPMNIKNGMLITMASGTIGNILHGI